MSKNNSQVITCKAAICWGSGEALKVEEIQVEPPKSCEVRLKMLCASLCHTDILFFQGLLVPLFPRVLGHEGVGMVESMGNEVREVKEGDVVIPTYLGECGECDNCMSGTSNLCHKYPLRMSGLMQDDTSRMSIRGQKLYHTFSCSTWSEYTVVDANYIVKIHSTTPLPHASFISCGFSTGFGAAWKEAKLQRGSSVAVLGLGAVGLGVVEGARMQGAARIIGVDKNERKREKGQCFGMTDFINPEGCNESISEVVKKMTGGMGVDYCFECTGVAPLVNEAVEATKMGKGTTILIGAVNETSVHINFIALMRGRTLKGSTFGGIKVQSDLPIIVDKCINKEIQLDELGTHEVSLEDINKAFELTRQPDCVKVVIKM
ncbi:hypothetical protein L1049_003200 [Liquidambar formosana]|uniref:Enoyl reductase (ER) domain-containing protein n=1 Tax=Liquidambar formosana TaxID=63359 RepID=A0AAP0NGB6_LIQFO